MVYLNGAVCGRMLPALPAGRARRVLHIHDLVSRVPRFWRYTLNRIFSVTCNMLTGIAIHDVTACYKVFRREIIQSIKLEEKRFGFEPEVTAKISRVPKIRIYEVGISYYGRTYEEGKKIGAKDGFRAIYCILKYNLFKK